MEQIRNRLGIQNLNLSEMQCLNRKKRGVEPRIIIYNIHAYTYQL